MLSNDLNIFNCALATLSSLEIGLIVLAFNYLGSNNREISDQNGDDQEQNEISQDNQGNNVIGDGDLGEKPPRPPE